MPLTTASRLLRVALRTQVVPVANLTSKPAKHLIPAGIYLSWAVATNLSVEGRRTSMSVTINIFTFLGLSFDFVTCILNIFSKEQAIAMTVLFATILGPSGWILAHLEDYKKKQ